MKTYTVEQMLAAVQRKRFSGRGIGTADGYVQTVFNQASCDGFVKQFPGKSAEDFRKMVKDSAAKFVFRPAGAEMTAYTKQKKYGSGVVSFGKSVRKEGKTLSTASVMDFENILTSKSRDRDGDELHPKGAKVDLSMPLLWQHIPTEPIGKLVQVLEQTDDLIKTHFAIADTALGRDSAMLVEFGALRISHGFKPVKYEALEEDADGEPTGWKVLEYDVMEGSLVSVPANTDAVITAYSRNKLNSPLVKGWAGGMYADRPKMVKGGYGGIVKNAGGTGGSVNVTINMPKDGKPKKKNAGVDFGTVSQAKGTAGVKCFKCGAMGMIQCNAEDIDEARSMMLDVKCPTCGSQGNLRVRNYRKGVEAPKKKEQKPEPNTSGKEKPEGLNDETPTMLSDVATRAGEMAENEGLSNEIRSRMSVVSGIITDVAGDIASGMEQITAAAGSQDLAGVSSAHNDMIGAAAKRLQRAADELARVAEAGDLEEADAEAIKEMSEQVGASLTGISGAMDDETEGDEVDPDSEEESGGDGDETGDWVDTGAATDDDEDEDDSELEEEEEEKEEDATEDKDEDEEESESKEDDEDETEEKDEDEDTEEKAGQVFGMHCLDCGKVYTVDTDRQSTMKCPKCGSKNWEIVNRTSKDEDETEEKEEDDEDTEEKGDDEDDKEEKSSDEDQDEIEKSEDDEKDEDDKTEPKGSKEDDEDETEEKEAGDENPEVEVDPEEENPGIGKGKKKPKKQTTVDRAKRLAADIVGGKSLDKATRRMLRDLLAD